MSFTDCFLQLNSVGKDRNQNDRHTEPSYVPKYNRHMALQQLLCIRVCMYLLPVGTYFKTTAVSLTKTQLIFH